MTIQEAYEKNGWNFDDTGGNVIVGRKNVTLKDGRKGCVMVTSDLLNIINSDSTYLQKIDSDSMLCL